MVKCNSQAFRRGDRSRDDLRAFLGVLVESSSDAIISRDLNGIITCWNRGAERIFGYTTEEAVGQSILILIPSELHREEEQILTKLRAGERIEHFETTRLRKNGEKFPIFISIFPMSDSTGVIVGASEIGRDSSERLKADESRFRLAAIVNSADDAIISKDLNGFITSWNKGAYLIFGCTAEEMIGQSILRLIPEELHHEEDEILRKLRAGEKIEHYETTRVRKSGQTVEVSVTISPIRDSAGQIIGASKIARNISDRKKTERLLVQSEKLAATGRMAAAIAHEINNPLASVLNLIFLARQAQSTRAQIQSYLETAESELDRVSQIARQTLGYYRDTTSPTEVHLHELMENILVVYRSKLISHNIRVEKQFNDLRKIKIRSGEIIQLFANLVSNAVDAMPQGGTLSIFISRTMKLNGDGVQTIIRDTGCGINGDNLGRVFEPFFTTKGNLGTGIGLWVAKQIVEHYGGQISISSTSDTTETGTVVTVYLPYSGSERRAMAQNGPHVED